MYRCYAEMEHWVPETSPQNLAKHVRQFLLLYCELREQSADDLLWCLYPKHHLLIHIGEGALTNPGQSGTMETRQKSATLASKLVL